MSSMIGSMPDQDPSAFQTSADTPLTVSMPDSAR
jgi:hypothetical protein